MSKAPAMPMYWDAYLADTTHLTTEEHGAYMLLLAAMWRRNGAVPDDDKDNARILGLTPAKWRKMKARFQETISGFCVEDGLITQEKLRKIWENTQEKIAKNKANGAKGGRPKSNKNNDLKKPNGFYPVKRNESIPYPEPEPEPYRGVNPSSSDLQSKPRKRRSKATPIPDDWVPELGKAKRLMDELDLTRDEMNYCFQRMKDHAHATDRRQVDWDRSFASWVRKAANDGEIGAGAKSRRSAGRASTAFDF